MKFTGLCLLPATASAMFPQTSQRDYPFKPVPFTAVHLNDSFWAPRIETNRKITIPFTFQECEITDRIGNFDRAAEALRGQFGDGI